MAIAYLVDHALLTAESIVEDGIVVRDVSRRNLNLAIVRDRIPSYFLKQGKRFARFSSVKYESAFYERIEGTRSARIAPNRYLYDQSQDILVVEYITNAKSIRELHGNTRRKFPVWIGKKLGRMLATLHRPEIAGIFKNTNQFYVSNPPPALFLPAPDLQIFRDSSAASLHLIRIVQQYHEFAAYFSDLRQDWQDTALIHGDLKWDNCLVVPQGKSRRSWLLKLVDWETHALGDPLWDVGTIISECLRHWLNSIPIANEAPSDELLELAGFHLPEMQRGLQAFWHTYAAARHLLEYQQRTELLRAVKFAAVMLVQFAFEQMQSASEVNANVICFLQLSLNMLERTEEAATYLLGIPMHKEERLWQHISQA